MRLDLPEGLSFETIVLYHKDTEASLRLYFSEISPEYPIRFFGRSPSEVFVELTAQLDETELRSSLAILTSIEAQFKLDFISRCRGRLKDDLSRHFREIEARQGTHIRLEDDILEGWKTYSSVPPIFLGEIRGAFRFRHWLAHGRYWEPKFGRKYDFAYLTLMAERIEQDFPFVTLNK